MGQGSWNARPKHESKELSERMNAVLELILFNLRPETDRAHYLDVSFRATDWLRARPGYLGREVFEDASGQWIDMVRWKTLDDATSAAEAFTDTPLAAEIMDAVVHETIRILHPQRIAS